MAKADRALPSLDDARGKAVDILSEHFAHDLLSLEEFERLVTRVQEARSVADVGAVVDPFRTPPDGPQQGGSETAGRLPGGTPPHPAWATRDRGLERARDSAVAVLGETKRTGHWVPARMTSVMATLGSVEIDLRDAALGPGEFVFDIRSILGSVEIIAPLGLRVECGGSAILGSIDPGRPEPVAPGVDRPLVRLNCMCLLGEIEVDFRLPGETKRQAKRRRKREDRERKRAAAGKSRFGRRFGRFTGDG